MANFNIPGSLITITTTYKTAAYVACSATLKRNKLYDILIGTTGTPADNAMQWDVSRTTAAGTPTTYTPSPLDPADGTASMTAGIICTGEPTVTANSSLFNVGVNQRASYRWVAAPGSELVYPATQSSGLAGRVLSASYTGAGTFDILVCEQ